MAALSGLVAILNEAGDQVIDIRDLGPTPIQVKSSRVKPCTIVKPELLPDEEEYTGFTDEITADLVTRTWTKVLIDWSAIDQSALNAALIEEGSVVRALGLITFEEINKLRQNAGLQQYTLNQFKTALINKMRTT